MARTHIYTDDLVSPIRSLESYLQKGGVTIIQAAFEHSFFAHPNNVREKTPRFPDRARYSREHYPGLNKGDRTTWKERDVRLDDNSSAQRAWVAYSGRPIERGSGYGVRHIWGHPWNPDAFTAGWNLCYMPFWAGMMTEEQHPHPDLKQAIRQAAWDLYFREDRVCEPLDFVKDPGVDLESVLGEQPLLILAGKTTGVTTSALSPDSSYEAIVARVKEIRSERHQSWSNIHKAARALQGKGHKPFGTPNVEASAKSDVRRIQRETGLNPAQLEDLLNSERLGQWVP